MGFEFAPTLAGRPAAVTATRKSLLSNPVALAVIDKSAYRYETFGPKEKQAAGERVFVQLVSAELGQGINSFATVDRFDCDQDPHLRSYL